MPPPPPTVNPARGTALPAATVLAGCVSGFMILVGAGAAVLESNNHSFCDSGLGQFAQVVSPSSNQSCAFVSTIFFGGIALALIGGFILFATVVVGAGQYRR